MFVRTTELQADPAKIEDGITIVRDDIFPAVSEMSGCVGMSLLVNRDSGRCIATTAWESEDAMRESAETVMALRDRAQQSLGGSGSEVHQWEVAVVHRDHAAPEGACARLTWLSGDPAAADRAIDTYKMAVLPRLEAMDGFCSASLMIDREAGRVVGTVVFETRRPSRPAARTPRASARGWPTSSARRSTRSTRWRWCSRTCTCPRWPDARTLRPGPPGPVPPAVQSKCRRGPAPLR